MLPSKTVPERSGRSAGGPQLRRPSKISDKAKGKRKQRSLSRESDGPSGSEGPRKISRTATVETVTDDGDVPSEAISCSFSHFYGIQLLRRPRNVPPTGSATQSTSFTSGPN